MENEEKIEIKNKKINENIFNGNCFNYIIYNNNSYFLPKKKNLNNNAMLTKIFWKLIIIRIFVIFYL